MIPAMEVHDLDGALHIHHATTEAMRDFSWPEGLTSLAFFGDYLDELTVPEGVESVCCGGLGLRKLTLPSTIRYLYASMNNLRELTVPCEVLVLELSYNPLYDLRFLGGGEPTDLGRLWIRDSYLSSLAFHVGEECEIDAVGCRKLKHLTTSTSYAVRSFWQQYLGEPKILPEPEEWTVTP